MKKALSCLLCLALLACFAAFPVSARDGAIAPIEKIGFASVCYHVDDTVQVQSVRAGRTLTLSSEYAMKQYGSRVLVGWKTESGDTYYYDNTDFWRSDGSTDLMLQSGETYALYPIWCPIALRKDEVFSFTNSESVFNADLDGYIYTRRDFMRIMPNWFFTFALSPFAPVAAFVCAFELMIWPTLDFNGSCCGFPTAELLQHYGRIDLLSEQGVSSVSELQPDEKIQSIINYYNIHAIPSFLTNHIAALPSSPSYGKELTALYETLAGGTPVYFELYGDGPHLLRRVLLDPVSIATEFDELTAHGVLLTGAYTDGNGNHVLIMNDSNSTKYVSGGCDVLYIDPDFTQIYSSYAYGRDYALDGFSWNDSVDQFASFKTQGVSNPFAWHVRFLKNLPALTREVFAILKTSDSVKN